MAERLVAADASPLIGLAAAGAFHLLRTLFGQTAAGIRGSNSDRGSELSVPLRVKCISERLRLERDSDGVTQHPGIFLDRGEPWRPGVTQAFQT